MYITGLEASGLKGGAVQHQLQRCVLITGPNFSGKTTRLDAIRFALLGNLPDLGKTNQATWDLSSHTRMDAKVAFDDGSYAIRSLISEGGSIKQGREPIIPLWLEGKKLPMLDLDDYFNQMNDSERIQLIFTMMKMPDMFTVDGILADLRNLTLEENTEQTEAAKTAIIGTCENVLRDKDHQPISKALTRLTRDKGTLKETFAYWNKRKTDTQGTLRVLSELKTRSGECSADTIQMCAAELARCNGELAAANERAGALSQQQMEANRVALRRKQIDNELTVTPVTDQAEIDRLLKAIAAINKTLKIKGDIAKQSVEKLREVEELHAKADAADRAATDAEEQLEEFKAQADIVKQQREALEAQTSCPHCHSKGKGWKANLDAGYESQLSELNGQITTIYTQSKALRKKHATADAAYHKVQNAYDARHELLNERHRHQQRLDAINAATAGATARRQALQEEASRLRDTEPPTQAELDASAAEAMRLRQEHDALTQRHTALVALQQDLIRAGEAAEEHQAAAAKVTVIKAVGALLKERQASMIAVLFGDLMEVANYFTQGIMEHDLVFQDGRIGYVKAGRFVSHKTFSGTEKALTYIAITVALMKDAPLRLVLLDEFDIDFEVFPKVLNRLNGAVSDGLIDQVIVAHTEYPGGDGFAAQQWQHIPLTKAA